MDIFSTFQEKITAYMAAWGKSEGLSLEIALPRMVVEPPRDPSHGDMALNAAMIFSKIAGQKPRDLAGIFVAELNQWDEISRAEIAGPGFINLHLSPAFWQAQVKEILKAGVAYGKMTPQAPQKAPQKINVEYVSVNPTGPMHVGHSRVAIVGDVLANLLEMGGHTVTREFYVNDAGAQVDHLADSVYARYREALGHTATDLGEYPADYLIPTGKALAAEKGTSLENLDREVWLPIVRPFAVAAMMDLIREDLALLGIYHDVFTSELALLNAGKVDQAIAELSDQGLAYKGSLPPPRGQENTDWKPVERLLFKSTAFGDEMDRALTKEEGRWTYFAGDIAYHWDKLKRGHVRLLNVWGADHGGHVPKLDRAVQAVTGEPGRMQVLLCSMVKFLKDGHPVTMSKRTGNFISVKDVVDEVGPDVMRFIMMTRRNDAPLDFDFEAVTAQSKDNPVFYVQYAHARACSVLKHGAAAFPDVDFSAAGLATADLSLLTTPEDLALIKILSHWPRQVSQAIEALEPHRLAYALQDVAGGFHSLWNQGKDNHSLRFIDEDNQAKTVARLSLVFAMTLVLHSGLNVFGVRPLRTL